MPADERIKIIFKRVFVRDDADFIGSGEFFFIASVGGVSVGDPSQIFDAVEGRTIDLPEATWSGIVDTAGKTQVVVDFEVRDQDVFFDDRLGRVRHTLNLPYTQQVFNFKHGTKFFLLEWEVQLAVDGAFGRHPPNAIFACREAQGSVDCTTVSGTTIKARMEIHPVRPVPAPPPATVLPVRPAFPPGTLATTNGGNTNVAANSPMNIIPNPAVIPVLGPPAAAPAGPHTDEQLDNANFANLRNCARIEFTQFQPASLNFTDSDPRLEWRAVSIAGGAAVGFLGPPKGTKVLVFGLTPGEVLLEVRFKGALFATYRALVQNIRQVPCRCNILNGPTKASIPRVTPADAKNHIDLANRFMAQLALRLTLDTNASVTHGAQGTGIPGIFRIKVPAGHTRNVVDTNICTIKNHRPGVMNFAYIHSDNVGNLGAATDFPASGAGASITDSGTPSTSWVRPTGVGIAPDNTTATVTMNLIAARQRVAHPQLFAMYLTDSNGGAALPVGNHATLARQQVYANTMAHEFGHILNLGHRVEGTNNTHPTPGVDAPPGTPLAQMSANGIFWDGMNHPPHENVMQWVDPPALAQDFDIIQARGVSQSPLVTGATVLPPAVVPPVPPTPKVLTDAVEYVIVAGDWLSKISQRHGMTWQELWNFDGGTGVPNKKRLKSGDPNKIYPGEVILVPTGTT